MTAEGRRVSAWVATFLALGVTSVEFVYYLSHPDRSGPTLHITVLAVAVGVLGVLAATRERS